MKDPNSIAERFRPKSNWEKWRNSWQNDPSSPRKKWARLVVAGILLLGLPVALILTFNPIAMTVGIVAIVAIVVTLWAEPPNV